MSPRSAAVSLAMAALALPGCRSAAPEVAPEAPAIDARSPEAVAVEEEGARSEWPARPPAGDVDAARGDEEGEVSPAEMAAVEEPGQPVPDPQEVQAEALEMCQSAEALLDAGETEDAVAALDRAYELMLALPPNGDGAYLQAKEDIRLLVADLIERAYQSGRTTAPAIAANWDLAMPVVDNEHVQREIKSLTTVELDAFLAGYRRSGRYRPMILERLEEQGLPSQLSWLPLVESWFKVRAYSRASAVGIWQFISSTGLRYGLSRDEWVDERFDPHKATDAAIGYLTDLHGMFGDWPKALAAYNCGEARVARLQRRSSGEFVDFWDLYAMLPQETRRYVPRLFAAIQIIENPEAYGITLPEPDPPFETTTVEVARSVQLDELDASLGIPAGTLAELNPELRHKGTPKQSYALRVPVDRASDVPVKIASLPEWSRPVPQYVTHRVRSGETLSVIARRYGSSVSAIMRSNNLRSAHRIRVGQRLRIPSRYGAPRAPGPATFDPATGVHTVRRGDSLHEIASRYGTSVAQLKQENGLSSNTIYPGQELKVAAPAPGGGAASGTNGGSRYQVRSGDTLGAIADRHGVGLSVLLQANGLSQRSTIYPGQWLVIPQ